MNRLLLSIFLFISTVSIDLIAQDSLLIRNFGTGDYKAASVNYSGVMDEDGILYFANENGILKYDGSEWEIIPIINFSATFSINIAPDGRFYVGGQNEFGYLEKDSLNNYNYVSLRNTVTDAREFGPFWQIEYVGNNVYFGSYNGIVKYDGERGKLLDLKNSGMIKVDNEIILTQFDGGLYKIKNDSTYLINNQYNWKEDNVYVTLPNMADSTQLMFTSDHGIYTFDPKTNTLKKFETSDEEFFKTKGIYDAQIWRDSLYAISSWRGGMVLMDKKGNIVKKINKSTGLQSDQLRDFIVDKRGNIWIGGSYAINYLQWPDDYFESDYTPKTIITKVGSRFDIDNVLRSIEFHFATPGYDKADLQYSYYLDGYDEEYSLWNSDIKKEYTNLDGGSYIFKVKAKLPNGTETATTNYQFEIPIPWYKNKYFYGLVILVFAAFFIFIYRFRTLRLKRLNKRLENIINNRTKELILQREQLKEANEELIVANTELDNFVYRSSHDLVAPLKSLKGLINLAKIEAVESRQTEYLTLMNSSVNKLEDFIKSIMEYSVNSKREVDKENVLFDDVIDSICQDLQYYEKADLVKINKHYKADLKIRSDEKRLKIVLSNLITNGIKYHNYGQSHPRIDIEVIQDETNGISKITVADNGMGIDREHLDKIFDMFFRASVDKAEGSGLGLYIVKDTVGKLGGQISVDSVIGKGTTFTLTLQDSIIFSDLVIN